MLVYETDLLWKLQELNLFLPTYEFFDRQMIVSGGLLSYAGTFLTQFLYYPWLGMLILCCLWLFLMWLMKHTFSVPDRWVILMLIPILLILSTIVDMGYWVYMLKLRGHFFVTTLGVSSVVILLWCFRHLTNKYFIRSTFLLLVCVLGYPLFGIYSLATTVLMGLWTWKLGDNKEKWINSVLTILCVAAVPLFYYRYVYYETNLQNIYWTALPLYSIVKEHHTFYIPYYLLLLFFLIMVTVPNKIWERKEDHKFKWSPIIKSIVIIILAIGVYLTWYKDENFHHELKMQRCVEQADWKGVLVEASLQQDEPTRAIVMMRNIALARLGRQASDMYQYKNGAKMCNAPFNIRMMQIVAGPLLYYQYGLLNYCNRLCMEMGVEFGWRPDYLKYMVRCAILDDEQQVALKYLSILRHTYFFANWADQMESLVGHPELIAQQADMEPISHMMHYDNQLSNDNGLVEECIMRQLVQSRNTSDSLFQEQALLASLWIKNPKAFWWHFGNYVLLHPQSTIPICYQEAAYLYGKQEDRNLNNVPFDQQVIDRYNRFTQIAEKYQDMDMNEVRKALEPIFGHTYYYDYYLMSNLQQY